MSPLESNLQVWVARLGGHTLKVEQDTILLLSPSEKLRLNVIKSTYKRREFLLSRALMRNALSQLFGRPQSEWAFIYHPDSAPIISNCPKPIFTSLSHSNGLIVFVTSLFPVGVDIELVKEKENIIALADIFMSDDEIHSLKSHSPKQQLTEFYRIWCVKESYYKAFPAQQKPMKFNLISILDILDNHKDWSLIEDSIEQFIFSIVLKNKLSAITVSHYDFMPADNIL